MARGAWGAGLLLAGLAMAGLMPAGRAAADEALERVLTGGASRAWMATAARACGVADSLTFDVWHRVVESRCAAGRVVQVEHRWRVEGDREVRVEGMGVFAVEGARLRAAMGGEVWRAMGN